MAKHSPQDFETRMRRLQDIIQELEQPEVPLERSVALYKEGRELSRACGELLEKARNEVLLCGEDGPTPFPRENGQGGEAKKDDPA